MVIGLVGRRIDAPGSDGARFPLANVESVRQNLRRLFQEWRPDVLVSSAACGADLLALGEAEALGIRRRVVLPFGVERFRTSSVTDRPGDWGPLFDRIARQAIESGDLIVLESGDIPQQAAFASANKRIVDEVVSLSPPGQNPVAVLVWDGASRGDDDLTAAFGREAEARGFSVVHVRTV